MRVRSLSRSAPVPDHLPEGRPELAGHGAVQDEVDGPVKQSQSIHKLSEQVVALFEETPA